VWIVSLFVCLFRGTVRLPEYVHGSLQIGFAWHQDRRLKCTSTYMHVQAPSPPL
jgi:hypothetical protein